MRNTRYVRNDRNIRRKIVILNIEILVLFVLVCVLFVLLLGGKKDNSADVINSIDETVQNDEEYTEESDLEKEAKKIYKSNEKLLVLVNKENMAPDDNEAELIDICEGRLQASEWLYEDLKKMLADAEEEGYTFFISSAYRSKEKQQFLIDEDVEMYMQRGMSADEALEETLKETMPAGFSEHQTGLALDILSSDNLEMDITQAYDEGNMWLRNHCAKYGFIVRYPEDKVDITLISYEPWHFRYVGKEAAQFMKRNNLTLEEFVELTR